MNTEQRPRFEGIDALVLEPLRFKARLAIGENAYASLRNVNAARKYWDLVGAAGAGAALTKTGLLALGAASTPLGWVLAGAALSGGAWWGVMRVLNGATEDRVIVIPKFINTPIDLLALSLFDLMAPLALKLADADGEVSASERDAIHRHLTQDWGYNPAFVGEALALIEPRLAAFQIEEVAAQLATFIKGSPDCNYAAMTRDLLAFLKTVTEADGQIDAREEAALQAVTAVFTDIGKSKFDKALDTALETAGNAAQTSKQAVQDLAEKPAVKELATSLKKQAERGLQASGSALGQLADRSLDAAGIALDKLKKLRKP
ncbi:TerB family tellurite resistance protein [Paucibacter sp. JuS9]|uniref:TerB family tellurite resistance protein n=1 Tax=Paucibacter sp. JuS9 TaxID=3228748 RepID=UPI0037577EDB